MGRRPEGGPQLVVIHNQEPFGTDPVAEINDELRRNRRRDLRSYAAEQYGEPLGLAYADFVNEFRMLPHERAMEGYDPHFLSDTLKLQLSEAMARGEFDAVSGLIVDLAAVIFRAIAPSEPRIASKNKSEGGE